MSIMEDLPKGARSVGGAPTTSQYAGVTRSGAPRLGQERRTAQFVDRQSRDTETPLVAKRSMTETHAVVIDDAQYVYTLDENEDVHIRRCTTESSTIIVPDTLDGHTIVAVDHSAFTGLKEVAEIELPDCIRDVGWNAFANCPSLRRLKLPARVSKTDKTWLAGSTQIDELIMPDCVEVIDAAFLKSCKPLRIVVGRNTHTVDAPSLWTGTVREIAVVADNPFLSTDGICLYSHDGTQLLRSIVEREDYEVVPTCRMIGPHAFEDNPRIHTIVLPEGLESIGEGAFEESALEQVHMPKSLRTISAGAFRHCSKLTEVHLNEGLETIEDRAFAGCKVLTKLDIPSSVRHIGKDAVAGIGALPSIHPDNPLISIDDYGLLYQREDAEAPWKLTDAADAGLTSCAVRANVREIAPAAFMNHGCIQYIELPEGLEAIGASAFECCPNLHGIELPDTVQTIGERAFFCTPLEGIRIPAACTNLGSCALAYDPVQSGTGRLAAAAADMPFAYVGLRPASDEMGSSANQTGSDNIVADIQQQIRSRLTATPMGGAQTQGGAPAETRTTPLAVVVDERNPRFFVEGGLFCENAGDHIRVLLYTGPDADVVVPEQATEIAPYAFAGMRGIERLTLHDRITELGAGSMNMAVPPSIIRIMLSTPISGRTHADALMLKGREGIRALRTAFQSGTVSAPQLLDAADRAATGTRDSYEALRYALLRLADPFLLSDSTRASLERIAHRNPVQSCVSIAEHEWTQGFELMIELGLVSRDTIDAAIEKLGSKGHVAMTVQLIALKRRYFEAENDYSL